MTSSERIRVLLDTTYLLPIVGVHVEGVEAALEMLGRLYRAGRLEAYYTPFNLLEIAGKLSRIKVNVERVRQGLKAIRESFHITHPTVSGYLRALMLKRRGFRDLIDLLLYATARTRRLLFLTRDTELLGFLKRVGEDTSMVILEDEFIRRYGGRG